MFNKDTLELALNWAMYAGAIITYFAMKYFKKQRDELRELLTIKQGECDEFSRLAGAELVSIESHGRSLILTFAKDGRFIEVETMALMSTDVGSLRKQLGLE